MAKDELQFRALDAEIKFEYQFAILIFATLALSVQFSPPQGCSYKWLLISAWISFFISGVVAGWRLSIIPLAYRLNWGELTQNEFVKSKKAPLGNPAVGALFSAQRVLDSTTGKPMSETEYKTDLADSEKNLQDIKSHREKLDRRFKIAFWVQVVLFLVGVLQNGIFLGIGLFQKGLC